MINIYFKTSHCFIVSWTLPQVQTPFPTYLVLCIQFQYCDKSISDWCKHGVVQRDTACHARTSLRSDDDGQEVKKRGIELLILSQLVSGPKGKLISLCCLFPKRWLINTSEQ